MLFFVTFVVFTPNQQERVTYVTQNKNIISPYADDITDNVHMAHRYKHRSNTPRKQINKWMDDL